MADADTSEDEVPNVAEPDTTELDLWTWGLSGQPAGWALVTWTPLIEAIRAVNRGAGDTDAVQAILDELYPDAGYVAANVCLAHVPVGEFGVEVDADTLTVTVFLEGDEDLDLPDDNVEWDFGDGTVVHDALGVDHTYDEFGEYPVRLAIYVGGARYGSGLTVTVAEAQPVAYDPGAHTVAEVLAYVREHPDEADAIGKAELDGKGRLTIMDALT